METQSKTEKKTSPLLETGSLVAALPGNKSADQRPKYVQIVSEFYEKATLIVLFTAET